MVLAKQREQRMVAADILNENGAECVGFYGRWAWEGYPRVAGPTGDTAQGSANKARELAYRPEEIPSLFVEAWNRRDPNRIASLFDQDAEFVNVTGLWWHDRASIRKAHATAWSGFSTNRRSLSTRYGSDNCQMASQWFTPD